MDLSIRPKITVWGHSTSRTELVDIAKAWIALSLAFGIAWSGASLGLVLALPVAFVVVGLTFLLHELAHKVVAQRYGCFAEFRAFDFMLLISVGLAFLGVLVAAPGAVFFTGQVTRREQGLIAAAGPWTNLGLALVCLLLMAAIPFLMPVWSFALHITAWLAVFNMIPVFTLDGEKVWAWSKLVWVLTMGVAGVLYYYF